MHPCLADKALTLRMQQLQRAALSPATKRAYATGTKRYTSFCRKYSITPFPTTQLTLCYFAAYLSKQVQHATIRLYIAAVRAEQMSRGLGDPLKDTQQLSWLLRGVQRQSKTRTRLPINPKLLQQLIESILSNRNLSKYDRYLYATTISIAYFGCLRAGEGSLISIYTLLPPQATSNYKGHHHSPEHGTATTQKQQNRSIQERGHYCLNKTSVQCKSQSSSYTSGSMHTNQMQYSGSKTTRCLQDQDSKQ